MAINETIKTGQYYRHCVDPAKEKWERLSFWHAASDCELSDGSNLEDKLSDMEAEISRGGGILKFYNSTVSWSEDETYEDFPFRGTIIAPEVNGTYSADVRFNNVDSRSGLFANWCDTDTNKIYIYAWDLPVDEVIIPAIICTKVGE